MIHSGSRNIGKCIGDKFNDIALKLNKKWYSNTNEKIPFLPMDSAEGELYWQYMEFALKFALDNRKMMMDDVKLILGKYFPAITFGEFINIHHNYASKENHLGKNVIVHRKGATLARKGTVGIIPGSMGAKSYITVGLGNVLSLDSCSHGAGRSCGRKDFNRKFAGKIDEIEKTMEGIVYTEFKQERSWKKNKEAILDVSEAPQAYKDIDVVMEDQKDLVSIKHTLKAMISVKG